MSAAYASLETTYVKAPNLMDNSENFEKNMDELVREFSQWLRSGDGTVTEKLAKMDQSVAQSVKQLERHLRDHKRHSPKK